MTTKLPTNYFSRQLWYNNDNNFHIEQTEFRTMFQQHRNATKHLIWLNNEMVTANRQLKFMKDRIKIIIHNREQIIKIVQPEPKIKVQNVSLTKVNKTKKPMINQQNLYIIKSLCPESIFNGYQDDLFDMYAVLFTATIEFIAIFSEKHTTEKHLLIKLSNGNIDTYKMNRPTPFKESYAKFNRNNLSEWIGDQRQLEYYQRILPDTKMNDAIKNAQLIKIKNRPKSNQAQLFSSISPVLRLKYHIDPLSISCILEDFFGKIHTCDGRLIYPNELKILSNDQNQFGFYAIILNATKETQIYPIGINHHVRPNDQLFLLFNSDSTRLSIPSCQNCIRFEQTYVFNNDLEIIEEKTTHLIPVPKPVLEPEKKVSYFIDSQNYIVYAVVTSISIYVLCNMYFARKRVQTVCCSGKKHWIASRRGR